MGYPQEFLGGALIRQSNAFDTAEVLTAAAGVYGAVVPTVPITVTKFTFQISTAVSDLTASVVELQRVTIADVTSSIGIMTIPNGAAVRKVYYKDVTPYVVDAGDKLQFNHKTQGGLGGTPAGAGFYGYVAMLEPENLVNQTNAITA